MMVQKDLDIFCNDAMFKIEDTVVLQSENKFYWGSQLI